MCCMRLAGNRPTGRKKSPFWHHRTTLTGYIFGTKAYIDNRKKNLLNSNTSSTCPDNMVNFACALLHYRFRVTASYLSKVVNCNLPDASAFGASVGGDPVWVSARFSATECWSPCTIVRRCLRYPTFSRFSRTSTCDRRTDTRRQLIPALASVERVKTSISGAKIHHVYRAKLSDIFITNKLERLIHQQRISVFI